MSTNVFLAPPSIFYGAKAIKEATNKLIGLGNKALIVSGNSAVRLGYIKEITDILDQNNIEAVIYAQIGAEPDDNHVSKGVDLYQNNSCDFLIAIGGGSPLDAAKAIGLMVTNPGQVSDYMGLGKVENPIPPLVAIPTTAGTGSEVTQYTIINDIANDIKMLIGSPYLIPEAAIVDPVLTLSVPSRVTAATGIDALTHAIEGYTSIKNQPLTDNLALSAINRIAKNLRIACSEGDNQEARSQMILAAMEAGMVINNSSVTLVHGMSRPIGALFHIPHGVSNALLLGDCLDYAKDGNIERFARVAKAMGVADTYNSNLELAKAGIEAIKKLCADIKIPNILDLGIKQEEFLAQIDKMADDALASGSPANTYRQPSKADIVKIYKQLI
ncbi:1,3-propanediol dehydrogenase [Orenia metallireducens]|uniref:1,3-propanediol dehydrogenase n=1 Tax=Orenia metallireducens TaxID=1413210 RepID=A0A285I2P4_9FIRM|nr:iron-containing alcohol dehydrogenase [Orenia metallireducens]SNY41346.1 1,3-propanediol dehydrogenase [Orenia metallireducens]